MDNGWQIWGQDKLLLGLILLVGVVNVLPVLGAFSEAKLVKAYGISLDSRDLIILLRHRALLFGLIGGFVLVSLLVPHWRLPAMVLAGLSMLGFIVMMYVVGEANPAIARVALVDGVILPVVIIAVLMLWRQRS